jgi:hypothetical protein
VQVADSLNRATSTVRSTAFARGQTFRSSVYMICAISCATLLFTTMGVPPATVQRILRHSSITVTTGTYVEVIEAVQGDALDSMGTLFEQVGDDSSGRLSSMKPQLSSRLSSKARKSGPETPIDLGRAKGTRTPDHTCGNRL